MLRRRILASAMASVMAITSVAVVAQADDTTVSSVKTKADLEDYVNSFDSFRSNEIYDYGSISGENFLNALEYADNVLADDDSTVDDYTAAYAMVEAVYNKLTIYTAEQLQTLIDSCTKIYETNNIYNEELGDLIYDADSFSDFEDAYDDAESVLDSSDSRIISDAYEVLASAKASLSALGTVTKAQFRSALKAYETALSKEFAYDSWRVGTVSTDWTYWGYEGQTVAYGTLYEHVASIEDDVNEAYDELDAIKALSKTSQENIVAAYEACVAATAVLNGFTADDTNRATKSSVQSLLNEYHGRLVYDYATSDAEDLYNAVVSYVTKTAGGTLTVVQADTDYSTTTVDSTEVDDPWYVDSADYTVSATGNTSLTVEKLISAEISVKSTAAYYIELYADTGYATGNVYGTKAECTTGKYKLVSAKSTVDLTDYIGVTADVVTDNVDNHHYNNVVDGDYYTDGSMVDGSWWSTIQIGQWGAFAGEASDSYILYNESAQRMNGTYTNSSGEEVPTYADLSIAMELAETYIAGDKDAIAESDIYDIDTTDSISSGSAKGSTTEWTLVYRYLKYALSDKYDASYGTYTKSDVVELIDKCYDLADLTGDAALFNTNHTALVEARQDALAWVKAANKIKTYKDNVTPAAVSSANLLDDGSYVATQVYEFLEGYYETLLADYEAFKYSFGEIYDYIAEVSEMIDDGELEANATLTAALEDTAYYLSTVDVLYDTAGDEISDNEAFTSDRFFQSFNRVFTSSDNYTLAVSDDETVSVAENDGLNYTHGLLQAAYESLLAAVSAQTETTALLGDVNGDGVVNALDAAAILKAVVDGTTIEASVGDYNADGAVNALDAAAILAAVVAG